MMFCGVVCLASALADPGDVDKAFSEVTLNNGNQVFLEQDGTLWFVGDDEVAHLSSHGVLLNGYTYPGLRNVLPHPKGGISFKAVLEGDGKDRRSRRWGTAWIQPSGKVVETADLPKATKRSGYLDPLKTGRGRVSLGDGRFLTANSSGLRRWQADGNLDTTYKSTVRIGREGASLARRPDGRVMLAIEDGMIGLLRADEDDDNFILARLTRDGDHDNTFPRVVVPGNPQRIAATNFWTYYAGRQPKSDESLHRIDSGDAPPKILNLETATTGEIQTLDGRPWSRASVGAWKRGDGYDDLIIAEWGASNGLLHLINSKDPTKEWKTERIPDDGNGAAKRRLAIGKLDGDNLQDVVEWRLPSEGRGDGSAHWYQGQDKANGRTLKYRGPLVLSRFPKRCVSADIRLEDVDGDGDHDIIARLARHSGAVTLRGHGSDPPSLMWWCNEGIDVPWLGYAINKQGDYAGAPPVFMDDDGMPSSQVHVKDLDADGDPDVAVVTLHEKTARQWYKNVGIRFELQSTPIQVIPETARAILPGFDLWLGSVMAHADVNGDGKPDRILAFPGYEPEEDDDNDRPWTRGLRWEREE